MKLLWVDDDGPDRFLYELYALEKNGWHVYWAEDLASALRELASTEFDAILLDQMFPVDSAIDSKESIWSGALTLAWLRGIKNDQYGQDVGAFTHASALPHNQKVPVCLISAFYDEEVQNLIRQCERPGEKISVYPKPILLKNILSFLAGSP